MTEQSALGSILEPTEQTTATEQPQTGSSDFLSNLPEDIRNEGCFQNIKDLNSLAKSYHSAQKMLGSRIPIPTEDSSEDVRKDFYERLTQVPGVAKLPSEGNTEEFNNFFNALGRPETEDGYKYEIPEGVQLNQDLVNQFNATAHKAGLTQQAAQEIMGWYASQEQEAMNSVQEAQKATDIALKEQWGNAYDSKMQDTKAAAIHIMEQYGDDAKALINSPMGNNPAFFNILAKLGSNLHETGVLQGGKSANFGRTPEEAQAKINEIIANPSHAYYDASNPGHNEAVKQMAELYNDVYPS